MLLSFLFVSRCLEHRLATFDFESTTCDCFAVPFTRSARISAYFCHDPHQLDVKLRNNHAHSVSLNARHFMSAPLPGPKLPPRTFSSRTFSLVNAAIFLVSENNYTPADFIFQSVDRFQFSLSQCKFRVVPLSSIVNSLIVDTTINRLNFCWLLHHFHFPVLVHELQFATDGLPLVFHLLPKSRLKKNSIHILSFQTLMPGLIIIIA